MDVRQQLFSSRQKAEIREQILDKTWRRWQAMAPHPIPLPCALAFLPQPSRHHHAQSLLGPSFHDPRTHHVLESHPEQAAPPSALTPPLHCASILQPAAPPQVVAFES